MRGLLFGADALVAEWVGKRLGVDDFGPCTAFGITLDGVLIGGAVYNNYRHPAIELSFASDTPKWASKATVSCIFRYPFVELGCLRLTAFTRAGNERARANLLKIGFRQEGYHPHGFPDDDAVSYGALRENCRWVKNEVRSESAEAD